MKFDALHAKFCELSKAIRYKTSIVTSADINFVINYCS